MTLRASGHPHNALSAVRVRSINKPGMYADGNGLYLRVDPSGARRWLQRIVINGRRRNLGLGEWPDVSLAEARERAAANLRAARSGVDPLAEKHKESMPTFSEAANKVIDLNLPTWKSSKNAYQWRQNLSAYVFPVIGDRSINEITTADVLAALTQIWTGKHETARRIQQRIGAITEWAVAQGYRTDNPAGDAIARVLPKAPKVKQHMASVPYSQVRTALECIQS